MRRIQNFKFNAVLIITCSGFRALHALLNSALVTNPSPFASMALKAFSILVSFWFWRSG